jgi:hypothetical protein
VEVAVEIGQIASGAGRIEQRAESLLETLRRLVPFRAAGIFLLDAEHGGLTPAADQGYDEAVRAYITSRANSDEIEMLGFNRVSMPLRVQDLPSPAIGYEAGRSTCRRPGSGKALRSACSPPTAGIWGRWA